LREKKDIEDYSTSILVIIALLYGYLIKSIAEIENND
jgi:hypothetical protein